MQRTIHTFPTRSAALKTAIRITGIQLPNLQLIISLSMPGYRQSVTKYASPMDSMYGQMVFATFHRAMKPPETGEQSVINYYTI
jgi:hypothetical protein